MAEADGAVRGDGAVVGLQPVVDSHQAQKYTESAGFVLAMRPKALKGSGEFKIAR